MVSLIYLFSTRVSVSVSGAVLLYWSADAPGQQSLFLPPLIVFIYDRWNQRFHLRSEYEYSYLFDLPFRTHRSPADLLSRRSGSTQRAATVGLNTTFREDVRGASPPPLLQQPSSFVFLVFSGPNPYASLVLRVPLVWVIAASLA